MPEQGGEDEWVEDCHHIVYGPERPPVVFRWDGKSSFPCGPAGWYVAWDAGFWDSTLTQPRFDTWREAMDFAIQYASHPAWLLDRAAA